MPKLPQHIEERFDKTFVENGGVLPRHKDFGQTLARDLKSFIATIVEEERERIIKKIVKYKDYRLNEDVLEAVDDIINLIKKLTHNKQ